MSEAVDRARSVFKNLNIFLNPLFRTACERKARLADAAVNGHAYEWTEPAAREPP
jgi:hypothetical protein